MSKVAVVYWSGTGNTQTMAQAVVDGATEAGSDVILYEASDFSVDKVGEFDAIAFGCPAMGAEVLEEDEFEPMFSAVECYLSDKKIALFGSYGWGGGQWMRDWEDRCRTVNANLVAEGVTAYGSPSDEEIAACKAIGKKLA
ncbi:MAG: flavodoxin [Lachnospiraceae bacterium]|nr:flavodoxin [Lachnospiraceae bacterium]